MRIALRVNGVEREADCWEGESLLFALREKLEVPGSKNACEQGECGSCSVLLDGVLVCACLVLAAQADGHEVVTVEGLADGDRLHRVQEAFVEAGAVQCGFCTPGLVVAAADLLEHSAEPDATTRSARRCRATSAAAPATRRSSTRCDWPRGRVPDEPRSQRPRHAAATLWMKSHTLFTKDTLRGEPSGRPR